MSAEPALRDFSTREFSTNDWNVYRTRFLVRAKQLTQPLSFKDAIGREHHGSPGDYLVQSSEGLFRIAPREIFEDIYVVMEEDSQSWGEYESPARRLSA